MDERTEGIVLRTRLLTETSLIVHWLTPDLGRVATVAKGARRPKSPFAGKLDFLYHADFSFQRSRSGDLHALREVVVRDFQSGLRKDVAVLSQASYWVQLIEQLTETESPVPKIFDLFRDGLKILAATGSDNRTVLAFEVKLLSDAGLSPVDAGESLSLGAREILQRLGEGDWELLLKLRLSPGQERELTGFLEAFLRTHLDRVPGSRSRALEKGTFQ